jgi:hypothetical protein
VIRTLITVPSLVALVLCGAPAATAWPSPPAPPATCTTLVHHSGEQAWFDRARANSPLFIKTARLICSTIDIAEFFITPGTPETDLLSSELDEMSTQHDVTVNVLVNRGVYADKGPTAWSDFTTAFAFAHIYSCLHGCRSTKVGTISHSKWITVSRTRWGFSAVLSTSANWSGSQWDGTYQDGLYFYHDKALYHAFRQRFTSLVACATGSCPSDENDPVVLSDGTWYDANGVTWTGVSSDSKVYFAPVRSDPLVADLSGLTCGPGGTIDVMSLFIVGRQPLVNQLLRLKAEGCAVQVILQTPPSAAVQKSLQPVCATSHAKVISITTGTGVTQTIAGSEDLTDNDYELSDNQTVLTTNTAINAKFAAFFQDDLARAHSCTA